MAEKTKTPKKGLKLIQSGAEAREKGRKGGISSGKTRREKRSLRQCLEILLSMRPPDGLPGADTSEAVSAALIRKALKGDVAAFLALRDSIGEKPTEKMKSETEISGKIAINPLEGLTTQELQRLVAMTKGIIHEED